MIASEIKPGTYIAKVSRRRVPVQVIGETWVTNPRTGASRKRWKAKNLVTGRRLVLGSRRLISAEETAEDREIKRKARREAEWRETRMRALAAGLSPEEATSAAEGAVPGAGPGALTGTLREIANRVILTLSRSAPEELHEDLESYGFTLASENQARWFAPAESGLMEAVRTLLALRGYGMSGE